MQRQIDPYIAQAGMRINAQNVVQMVRVKIDETEFDVTREMEADDIIKNLEYTASGSKFVRSTFSFKEKISSDTAKKLIEELNHHREKDTELEERFQR
ncbi:MAG: hypothetical protein PVG90_06570 [Bacillota bacterium]|jgi:hypothetical protein